MGHPTEHSPLDACRGLKRPDLFVYIGYGDELPVFIRARALWEFYMSHFPGIRAIFVRTTDKLPRGEVSSNGYDLLVGLGESDAGNANTVGYRQTGVWSARENADVIFRQVAVYDYLLRKYPDPFYLFHATVTSVIDFRGLLAALETMGTTNCFAGSPGRLSVGGGNPQALGGLTYISGANTLFSSDMLVLLRNRYNPRDPYAQLPNDVWQALTLQEIARTPLPLFSFVKPRTRGTLEQSITQMVKHLVALGHYHFRIKTTSQEQGQGLREDVDPWVMLRTMEAILESDAQPDATRRLIAQMRVSVAPANGVALSAFNESTFFAGPRSFPMTDIDAETLYPELAV